MSDSGFPAPEKIRRVLVPLFLLGASLLAACAALSSEPLLADGETVNEGEKRGGFPVESLAESNDCYDIRIAYPFFGRPDADQALRRRVEALLLSTADEFLALCRESPKARRPENAFSADYALFGTPQTISVVFSGYTDSGGAHGLTEMESLTWLVSGGEKLDYADIFARADGLWEFLADYARGALRPELEEIWLAAPEFAAGLDPVEASFRVFALTPEGLSLFFPPYQTAPHAYGTQRCDVPLEDLLRFVPRPGIWQAAP
ncbi:MAG: DUF3298 and DUF4163 domain-containing protein [Deltaproteobacteria bacterium]|jgi:hypothetical protein|nr:DUF3298 and DUF4163 domain-containing protein [Deltaproteobacteria bacterium]